MTQEKPYAIGIDLGGNFGCFAHCINIAAKYLDADRTLILENIKFLAAFYRITDKAFRGNKLGVHHIHPVLLTHIAKGRIAYILHWSQQQRKFA